MNFLTIIIILFVALFLILSMPVHLVLWLIGRKKPGVKYRVSHKIIRCAFNCIMFIGGVKKNVIGVENVPTDTPVLFVSNHRSWLDILLVQTTCGIPVGFVAKKELNKIPLLGLWMADIGCVFLDRANIKSAIKSMSDGVEHIKDGCSMTICPEGTRGHGDDMAEFKDGSLKMATKAKVPVVPVAVLGTDDCLENNSGTRITRGTITVAYGKPIDLAELSDEDKKHLGRYTQGFVKELYEANKEQHVALNQKKKKK